MLDVIDFIAERGGDPERVRESQRKRFANVASVNEIIGDWEDHRATQYEATQVNSQINAVQREIGRVKKEQRSGGGTVQAAKDTNDTATAGKDTDARITVEDLLRQKDTLVNLKRRQEALAGEKLLALTAKLKKIGNYVHASVPVSANEDDNVVQRTWKPDGYDIVRWPDSLSHHEVLTRLNGYDPERGVKIVGHRGYCLTGIGVFLNQALINYSLEFLWRRGYTPNQPPYFMLKECMAKTAQLEQFDEELYKVTGDTDPSADSTSEKYLIATSEQPLSAIHAGEWFLESQLPTKYAGYSTNFRKEAGAHGKDAWGIFRVHQFEKVEQFVLCRPEDSWNQFEEMIAVAEDFYKSLGLPYRVVSIVSGALNNAASKKYDLEAWFPYQGEYKELVSCSNCTDYQTRELDIRYGPKKLLDSQKKYVHALNATLCATERTLCCILENHQTQNGVNVPQVLRKYIPDTPDFIPYVKELPKDSTSMRNKPSTLAESRSLPVRPSPP